MYKENKIKNIRMFLGESLYLYTTDESLIKYANEKYKQYNLVIK